MKEAEGAGEGIRSRASHVASDVKEELREITDDIKEGFARITGRRESSAHKCGSPARPCLSPLHSVTFRHIPLHSARASHRATPHQRARPWGTTGGRSEPSLWRGRVTSPPAPPRVLFRRTAHLAATAPCAPASPRDIA